MSVPVRSDSLDERRPGTVWTGVGRIGSSDDVARVLGLVTAAGQHRDRTAAMTRVIDRASDIELAEPDGARVLPLVREFEPLSPWPGGLCRGATVSVTGSHSLLYALLAAPMTHGAWAAI